MVLMLKCPCDTVNRCPYGLYSPHEGLSMVFPTFTSRLI